jgi:phosphoglycerate dehydrogenase-like enzyme
VSGGPGAARPVQAAFCGNDPGQIERVFGQGRRELLEGAAVLHPSVLTRDTFDSQRRFLGDVEALFSTWGMDADLALRVRELPNLKAFFYAAGTVQAFARPLLERGIVVVSAWAANAVPVAQFTLAQILLALKGYFRNVRETALPANRGRLVDPDAPGVFGETVALLGCGRVGRAVAGLLRPFDLEVLAYDPYLTEAEARALGVRKAGLAEAFATAYVVSNHLADLPPTRGLLGSPLFRSMRRGAAFINTGRGATVVEADLAAVLAERPDLSALLDVTCPEPAPADSPWHALPNVHLSSHIAGSSGKEVARMADYCLEEFAAWKAGRPLRYRVTAEMLETMA